MCVQQVWMRLLKRRVVRLYDLKSDSTTHGLEASSREFAHALQGFPFALVSMNVTRWALDLLESGKLNAASKKLDNAARACDLFHVGCMYIFAKGWAQRSGGTILDVGVQLSAMEKRVNKSPGVAVAAANQVLIVQTAALG